MYLFTHIAQSPSSGNGRQNSDSKLLPNGQVPCTAAAASADAMQSVSSVMFQLFNGSIRLSVLRLRLQKLRFRNDLKLLQASLF